MKDTMIITQLQKTAKKVCCAKEQNLLGADLTLSEFSVLEVLKDNAELPTQVLAKKVQLKSGSITHVMNKLIKKELIEKKKKNTDKRYYYVTLSKKGLELINKIYPAYISFVEDLMEGISEEEKQVILDFLAKINQKVEYCEFGECED